MAEKQEEQDPRKFRGGVHEPDDAKGEDSWADNEGVVPREMLDERNETPDGGHELGNPVQGQVTDRAPDDTPLSNQPAEEGTATEHSGTGANAQKTKEEMDQDEPVSWVQGANVARENPED